MRIFLDANILFTAALSPDGKSAWIISNAGKLGIALLTSDHAEEEADRNLRAKYPGKSDSLVTLLSMIEVVSTVVTGRCPVPLPHKDLPIFLTARAAGATHLLTGDTKDFGAFMNKPGRTGGIVIQTAGDFLRSL